MTSELVHHRGMKSYLFLEFSSWVRRKRKNEIIAEVVISMTSEKMTSLRLHHRRKGRHRAYEKDLAEGEGNEKFVKKDWPSEHFETRSYRGSDRS